MGTEPWFKKRPSRTMKNDLEGKRLNVYSDIPPQDFTTPKGFKMNQLTCWDKDTGENFKCLVTDIDLDAICKIVSDGDDFTFVPSKSSPYHEVATFVKA